jgi:hypothetical protein
VDHQRQAAGVQTQPPRDGVVVHLVDDLQLEKVIARAERAELPNAALERLP